MVEKKRLAAPPARKNRVILLGAYVAYHVCRVHVRDGFMSVALNAQSFCNLFPQCVELLIDQCHQIRLVFANGGRPRCSNTGVYG